MAEQRKQSFPDQIADKVEPFLDKVASRVAEMQRPVAGNVPVSKDERRRRWWQEDDGWAPEHERMLLTATYPDGSPILDPATGRPRQALSREDVGLLKYPYREVDALAFGAGDERKMALYAKEMTELGPPEPGPLEQAAMQARGPAPTPSAAPAPASDGHASGMPVEGGVAPWPE